MPSDITASPVNLPAKRSRISRPVKSIPTRPVGRPTNYKPEYCATAERLGKQGKSPAQIAAAIGVDKATMLRWAAGSDEFTTSLSRAKTFEQAYWEERGHKSLNRKHFQAQVWRTSMSARFKDDYTEARNVDVTVSLEGIVSALQQREAPKVVEGQATLKDDAHTQAQDVVGVNGRIYKATD